MTRREKLQYDVRNRDGIAHPIGDLIRPAIRYAPGLIIMPSLENDTRKLKTAYYWRVTHEASGFGIGPSLPRKHARMLAGALAALPIDWTIQTQEAMLDAWATWPEATRHILMALYNT